MDIIAPFLFSVVTLPFVVLFAPIFIYLIRKRRLLYPFAFTCLLVLWSMLSPMIILPLAARGIGQIFCVPAIVMPFLSLMWLTDLGKRASLSPLFEADKRRYRLYLAALALIPLAQAAPLFSYLVIRPVCHAITEYAAEPILTALEDFHQERGHYPMLGSFSPTHFQSLAITPCLSPEGDDSFSYCIHRGNPALVTRLVTGIHVYDLETREWLTYDYGGSDGPASTCWNWD